MIYDAPKREVTAMAESADGRLYVAAVGEKTKSNLPPLPVQGLSVATATITIVTPGSVQASSSNGLIPDGTEVDELCPQGAPRKLWAARDDVIYALRATPEGLLPPPAIGAESIVSRKTAPFWTWPARPPARRRPSPQRPMGRRRHQQYRQAI